jgi:hypothetical protein
MCFDVKCRCLQRTWVQPRCPMCVTETTRLQTVLTSSMCSSLDNLVSPMCPQNKIFPQHEREIKS